MRHPIAIGLIILSAAWVIAASVPRAVRPSCCAAGEGRAALILQQHVKP